MKEKIITLYRSLDMAENIENEDITIDDIQERLSQIEKLYKYGKTIEEIINYEKELEKKLSFFDGSKFDIKGKKEELKNIKDDLTKKASQIHNHRVKWKVKFQEKVNKELENVAMKGSKFYVDIDEDKETFKSDGFDNVRFLIDTTGKGKFPLNMIASGGELSRIMLVLKEIFIDDDSVETLIFDEIDMGIGGQTALSVGAKIEKISKKKQVITITHLHQIAKFADYHFSVEKKKNKAETYTTINKLDQKQKIEEIARMLGGTKMSENTVKLAKDLLKK
jgi:DNA repair protein RecN (Recombination protein N)